MTDKHEFRTKAVDAAKGYNGMRHVLAVKAPPAPDHAARVAKVRRVALTTPSQHAIALAAPATDGSARDWTGGWSLRVGLQVHPVEDIEAVELAPGVLGYKGTVSLEDAPRENDYHIEGKIAVWACTSHPDRRAVQHLDGGHQCEECAAEWLAGERATAFEADTNP